MKTKYDYLENVNDEEYSELTQNINTDILVDWRLVNDTNLMIHQKLDNMISRHDFLDTFVWKDNTIPFRPINFYHGLEIPSALLSGLVGGFIFPNTNTDKVLNQSTAGVICSIPRTSISQLMKLDEEIGVFWNLFILNPQLVHHKNGNICIFLSISMNNHVNPYSVQCSLNEIMNNTIGMDLLYLPSNVSSSGDVLHVI